MLNLFHAVLRFSFIFAIVVFAASGVVYAQSQDSNPLSDNNNAGYLNNQNTQNSTGFGGSNPQFNNQNQQSSQQGGERRRSGRRSSRDGQSQGLDAPASSSDSRRSSTRTKPTGNASSNGGAAGGGASISVLGGAPDANGTQSKQAEPRQVNVRPVNVFYLASTSSVMTINQPFSVDVKLSMPKAEAIDSLALKLRYDPAVLLPIQGKLESGEWAPANTVDYSLVEQDPALSSKDRPNVMFADDANAGRIVSNQINPSRGEIDFQTSALDLKKSGSYFIATLMFVPLQAVERSEIRFAFEPLGGETPLPSTHLLSAGQDWLGSSDNASDGVVPLYFSVIDPNVAPIRSNQMTSSRDSAPMEASGKRPAQLALHLEDDQIETGGEFNVLVSISNPDHRSIDELNLFLLYNPNVMQAVEGRAVLLAETAAQPMLPFDFTIHHEIDLQKGVIDLRKRASRSAVREGGLCAVIPFRALKPTTKTTIRLLIDGKGKAPTTGAFHKNRDALGDETDPYDGCVTTSVSIRPTAAYLESASIDKRRG